jgi:cation diffusion facilitator family transporter
MKIENFRKIKQVLWIILFANLGVAVLKIVIGSIIKSTSMTADGFHSLTDGTSNVIGLIGINFASKPVDEDHPYGHKKFETLAGLFIAGMLLFIGGKIVFSAVARFMNPIAPYVTLESLITLLVTLGVNIFVSTYEYKQGKMLKSHILISDSLHTRSDIYVSIGVILTLICVKLGLPPIIDPIASIVVSGFILHAAYEIFRSTSDVLVDKAAIDTKRVKEICMEFNQVKGVHKIRSRGSENDIYIDMHLLTEPNMSVEQSHELIHIIEKKMQNEIDENIQIISHIEPFYDQIKTNI